MSVTSSRRGRIALLALWAAPAACGDPTAPRQAPSSDEISVYAILDADAAAQPVVMVPVTTEGSLEGLAATIASADGVERFTAVPAPNFEPCIDRYGGVIQAGSLASCMIFDFAPRHGIEYRLTVSADGRPTATASARVPGDFRVLAADAEGTAPPGSDGLTARWTSSPMAYRYIVALRATCPPWYAEYNDCACDPDESFCTTVVPDRQGWYLASRDTAIATTVDGEGADEIATGRGPWFLDVYAMSRGLFDFLTTGNAGGLFPVTPVQNIEGGAGVFGALVRRTIELDDPAALRSPQP